MKVVGLIAEYNPFHNGHQYHIEQAKKITGADYVIVVMSGNFVQRGTPAIMPKHLRTKAALKSNVSLVLELPVYYATGSAEYFAYGAVSLLDKLGCVNSICFGSECGDIEALDNLAKIIHEEPSEYKQYLGEYLRQGNSFPLAREYAIREYLKSDKAFSVLANPNNILGIEYIKALYRINSKMKPYTITRVSSHYHDQHLNETVSSASAIRNTIQKRNAFELQEQIPDSCVSIMEEAFHKRYPIFENDFSLLLKYKLLSETNTSLTRYADVSEELANRICNQRNHFGSWEQFCELLKTKEITYSRISRALLHILLGIHQSGKPDIAYAHMLGFKLEDSQLLSKIKEHSTIPLISKLTDVDMLTENGKLQLEQDIYASNIYESVVSEKFNTPYINEYKHPIIRI